MVDQTIAQAFALKRQGIAALMDRTRREAGPEKLRAARVLRLRLDDFDSVFSLWPVDEGVRIRCRECGASIALPADDSAALSFPHEEGCPGPAALALAAL